MSDLCTQVLEIPPHRRPLNNPKNRRQTANHLINHILCRTTALCDLMNTQLYEHLLSFSPESSLLKSPAMVSDVIKSILEYEYGLRIINAIETSNEARERLVRHKNMIAKKAQRRSDKFENHENENHQAAEFAASWPSMVSKETVFECLKAYREATIWKEPRVCAICGQYMNDLQRTLVDDATACPLNLNLLRVPEEFFIRRDSPEFLHNLRQLDGLMLERRGIERLTENQVALLICRECHSSVKKSKMPRFALANNLYRGILPDEFADVTWVEEMVCARYRNTAHITRLYGSSDPAQPTVLHGNTCAHEMNIVSTASVLPWAPTDINGILSIVFIGAGKLKLDSLKHMLRVRKKVIWALLIWLKGHNRLYFEIPYDEALLNLYPEDGIMPGLENRIINVMDADPEKLFVEETAGFSEHPAAIFRKPENERDLNRERVVSNDEIMIEKMGVADPDCVKLNGRSFTAAALRNLVKASNEQASLDLPDLIIHRGAAAISEYNNPDLLPGMFPTLYPYGIGGFEDPSRQVKLSFQQQAQYYFNIPDRVFRYHYSFIFVAFNMWQRRQAHLHTSFTVKQSNFDTVARQLVQVSADTLMKLSKSLEKETTYKNLNPEEQQAMNLLSKVNTIAAHLPGSQAAKIFIRNEIRSYFSYFGLPHIYFTFNPCAAHSPIFQVMFGDHVVDLSEQFPQMPSSRERALRLAKDPVAAADYFEFCVTSLFKYLLGWDYQQRESTKAGGILGKIRAHYGTSEFTERGGLHGHFVIWLLGGLNPSDLHDKLRNDSKYESQFFNFFEHIIHHHLPNIDIQIDKDYEPRIQRPPVPPEITEKTPIAVLNEWESCFATEIKKCGEVLQRHICGSVCHKYGNDGQCRFLFPHEIVEASYFDKEKNAVVLLCRDGTVNYFNPYILVFCRHNHDIKCILSGKAAKAAMFYITDYITKMDLKTYQVLSLLSKAVAQVAETSQKSPVQAAKTLLHKCLSQFTRQQQIHAQLGIVVGFKNPWVLLWVSLGYGYG